MGSPQSVSIMQSTGGALNKSGNKTVMCKAFKAAVKQWCDEAKAGTKHNGDFNDYFFRNLQSTTGGSNAAMNAMSAAREAAYLNPAGGGAAVLLNQAPGAVGAAFAGTSSFLAAGASAAGFRWGAISTFISQGLWGQGRPMFPDAMLGNTPVEIKGPNDVLSTQQADKYSKINPNGDVIVVSCQSCKASCAKTNKCKK